MTTTFNYDGMRAVIGTNKKFRQDVEVQLLDLIVQPGPIETMELLSTLATGSTQLTEMEFRVVDFKGDADNTLIIEVSGDPSAVLDELLAFQLSGGEQ